MLEDALRDYLDYPLDWDRFKTECSWEFKLHNIFLNSYLNYYKGHIEGSWVRKICELGFGYDDLPKLPYYFLDGERVVIKCPMNRKKCFVGHIDLFDRVVVLGDLP